MTQQIVTRQWIEQLIDVIRDHRPIIYSDGGLTVFSSHGYHKAPGNKWEMALIQGFQDPIGVQALSTEYAYIRYIDSQLVISSTYPDFDNALLIATIYTDSFKVTQIINHMVELPDTNNLPELPQIPEIPPPYTLPQHLKGVIMFPIEKPKVKYYVIDTRAPFSYNLYSITTKTASGTATLTITKNGSNVSNANNINMGIAKATTVFNTPITINTGDEFGISITNISTVSDASMSIYVYSSSDNIISNTL